MGLGVMAIKWYSTLPWFPELVLGILPETTLLWKTYPSAGVTVSSLMMNAFTIRFSGPSWQLTSTVSLEKIRQITPFENIQRRKTLVYVFAIFTVKPNRQQTRIIPLLWYRTLYLFYFPHTAVINVCFLICLLVGWFLCHINLCWLFNAKSIFIQINSSISNNSV